MEHRVLLISTLDGDWDCLYVDGELKWEGHSITGEEGFDGIIKICEDFQIEYREVFTMEFADEENEKIQLEGNSPTYLNDIPLTIKKYYEELE